MNVILNPYILFICQSQRGLWPLPPSEGLITRFHTLNRENPELLVVTRLLLCQRIRIIKQFKDVNAEVIRAQVTSNSFDNTIMAYKVAS